MRSSYSRENRSTGFYTVVAVDQQFGTCVSESVFIEVKEATVFPDVVLSEIHPITNCDPAKANAAVCVPQPPANLLAAFKSFTSL